MELILAYGIVHAIVVWLMLAMIVGVFAKVRCYRSGFGWFLLAMLIGPLFAFLLVLILGKKQSGIYITQ